MTDQEHHEEQGGVRERLSGVVHAVQEAVADRVEAVADRVAPVTDRVDHAVDAVTSVLQEAGHAVTHRGGESQPIPEPDTGPVPVPSGTQIIRPAKGSHTFHAWRDGQWTPVRRERDAGWVWDA